jgi:hypothetical protein
MINMPKTALEEMVSTWNKTTTTLSENLTTNAYLPELIRDKLLDEDTALKKNLAFQERYFQLASPELSEITGLNILSGIQSEKKKDNLTVYRAIRFPTIKRIWESLNNYGISMSNFEQERILTLYENADYMKQREEIQKNNLFWIQPQERVVHGLPIFTLVNDALQIHHAYKNSIDKTLIVVAHIPYQLIKDNTLTLTANTAIDFDFADDSRDMTIEDFVEQQEGCSINYSALRAKGIELHELYVKGLPYTLKEHNELGIEQKFYLVDTYETDVRTETFKRLHSNSTILQKNEYFLHGFFGDHNIFGRRPTKYIPFNCYEVQKK